MASFEVNEDAWLARPDSDDLVGHPLFGGGGAGHASHAGNGLFMDVTQAAQNSFNTAAQQYYYEQQQQHQDCDEQHVRAASNLVDEDDDVAVARHASTATSMGALPPSQQYTEAASSEAFSQESAGGHGYGNPANIHSEEFLSFWSHKVPRQPGAPPTPLFQRTSAAPDESPSALIDGIVRAGLDTPQRPNAHFSRPFGYTPDTASTHSANTNSTHHVARDPDSPHSSNHSNPGSIHFGGVSPPNPPAGAAVQYRTVQQHLQMQQLQAQQQQQQQMGNGNRSPPQQHLAMQQQRAATARPCAAARGGDSGPIIVLEFKMDRRRRFRCRPELARAITPDQWVVVQLDNGGMDMGTCVEVFTPQDRMTIPKHYGHGECGNVVRLASEEDCHVINDVIPEKEENALAKAHQLVHFLHMPFTCIDAEFQFDLKVVNLYYTLTPQAFTSIIPNVSRLQRELGFLLKAKVHLEQLVPVSE